MPGFAEPEPRGRVVASVNPMNTGFTSTHDHDYGRRTLPGGHFSASFPPLGSRAGSPDPPGGVSANTEGGRKAFGRRWRRTEGDRKVFAAGEPTAQIQSTRRQTPKTDLRRRPEGGWKVGGWYRRRCEGARLRRWSQFSSRG